MIIIVFINFQITGEPAHDRPYICPCGKSANLQAGKSFMDMGGHQMQLNAVNREQLLAAQAHPENHKNLIVRVWGWSGYFIELDEVYQNHIIKRAEITFC